MKKTSKFQLIVYALFIISLVGGVVAFSMYRGGNVGMSIPQLTIWGTFPAEVFDTHVNRINSVSAETLRIDYVEKTVGNFSRDFIAALARGQGPDAVLLPVDMLFPHYDKIIPIPYDAFSRRAFTDTYIDQAQVYLTQDGILGIPFTVDPLVMYWNRDIFNSAGIATYPRTWDEFSSVGDRINIKDQNGNVRRSAMAMGDFANVGNAREILASLIMQAGNPITAVDASGVAVSTIKTTASVSPLSAIEYFIKFINPSHPDYSWNRSMPQSKTAFLSGTLATYFGFASEIADVRAKNPNLNFDVAPFPQLRSGGIKAVYGKMYGFSIVRSSQVPNAAYQAISILTAPQYLQTLSQVMYLPTVRRDAIAAGAADPYISTFNQAALVSKSWLDVDPSVSRDIFARMIQAITSGAKQPSQAIRDAGEEYDVALTNARR